MLPVAVNAQDTNKYTCTQGDLTRRVEIVAEPGVSVPCEVHYHKDTEAPGQHQVLWSAQNEDGYCEARTQEFVAQLTEWGWSCTGTEAAMSAPPEGGDPDTGGVSQPPPAMDDEEMLGDSGPENPDGGSN